MTRSELIKKLADINVNASFYSLDGRCIADNFIRQENYGRWSVFYFDEKGENNDEHTFNSEEDANKYLYELFASNADYYQKLTKEVRPRLFKLASFEKNYTLEINYAKGGVILNIYKNDEKISEELIADTYDKAITIAYKKYGLNPYEWEEKH